ncbi:MAG: 50S ribosomal protein L7/L12 [Candidatus Omnitrophica bacterium]|nr:50S ribosomal protein L7/L12 [Candidatus Omnitrophota bacterium]
MTEEKKEKTEEKKEKIEVSKKAQEILDTVETLSVLELSNLVKALEEKFGVTASAPAGMQFAAGMMPQGGAAGGAPAEEKTTFDVVLTSVGSQKIQVIKEVRAVTTLGLKEAKDLVEGAPKTVKEAIAKEEADKIKAQLEAVGAKVELK